MTIGAEPSLISTPASPEGMAVPSGSVRYVPPVTDARRELPEPADLLALAEQGYRWGRSRGLGHHDAQDVALLALERLIKWLKEQQGHPNPGALFQKILSGFLVNHLRDLERQDTMLRRLQRALRPADEGVEDRLHSEELARVRWRCERAGLVPGSRTWLAAMHKALGDDYADMAAMWPGTTKDSWRQAWCRARVLLLAAADEEDEEL